jgi:hypothetical protein
MTVRTTGQSPAPPRRRGDALRPPPSPIVAPPKADGEGLADDLEVGFPAAVGASASPEGAGEPAAVHRETRKEVREARQRRRQLMAVCAAVVAVCLVLTILIVSMARQRPSGLPAPGAPTGAVVVPLPSVPDPSPSRGAVAP